MSRSAIAILSTQNLLHNLAVVKATASHAKVIAMVKANAYGHGLRSVSSRLAAHVDILGVASIDEALALRKAGVTVPILLIEGVFEASELQVAATEGFQVVFHEKIQVDWLRHLTNPVPKLTAWLKVDTGMGRLGFSLSEALHFYQQLFNSSQVDKPIRILSHFACADMPAHDLNAEQMARLKHFTQQLKGPKSPVSLCNSAGIFQFQDAHHDYVRPGIALYGASPFANTTGQDAADLGLKPVMTLQTQIIAIRRMAKGSPLGYGARYSCPEDMLVGVVAFGYGDGYPRTARDGTPVLVNQTQCALVGRVSMDMITVDLRPCPHAKIGDPVILWGDGLPVETVAKHTEQISYDLLTGVQNRVKFHWTHYVPKSL